jgi:hypothetical protein
VAETRDWSGRARVHGGRKFSIVADRSPRDGREHRAQAQLAGESGTVIIVEPVAVNRPAADDLPGR